MENNKNPNIRFKGFTDPWKQRKLGDCFTERVESMPDGELISVTINDGIKKFSELGRHNNSNDDKSKYKKVCIGDIAYNSMRMWQGASGYSPYEGIVSPAYTVLSPNSGINSKCLAYQFKLPEMIHTFQINSQGITSDNWNLKYPALSEIEIFVSKNEKEQAKIAEYFEGLDRLITLHQRKYNKLLNVKKSMLEKMFPKNGSNIPEIRFKGFTDPWEQRKFTDITFLSGEKNKDNLPYESYSVTNENGFVPQNEQFENGGTMATADKRMYYIVSKNSFAYNPARINVGSIGYYDGPENVIVSSLYEVFKTSEDIDDRYLWHWFKSNNFKKLIEQYQEGGVRLYFYYDKLCMCSLPTPSIQEQIKIGRYFDNLDNLITIHQRELEKLQNIKKSMLEKMFV
ncbi:restriction endonuclease subunit S [Holdemanella biformis]